MTKDNNFKLEFNFNLTKEEVEMKCAKGQKITEDEYMRFMTLCSSNNLNPFNDVHIIKTDYRTCIMIGKDGYFKMADSNPAYDGMGRSHTGAAGKRGGNPHGFRRDPVLALSVLRQRTPGDPLECAHPDSVRRAG